MHSFETKWNFLWIASTLTFFYCVIVLKTNLKVNENANVFTSAPPKFTLAKKQKSIKKVIIIEGVGLHTGNYISMTLRPAP